MAEQLSSINVDLTANSASFVKQFKAANDAYARFTKNFRKNSTNISYQLQDIAVQAQAGTNALTIFSQQAPQLFQGFGAQGAAFGAVAAFSGLLLSAFSTDPSSAASQAEEQLRRLKEQTIEFTAVQRAAALSLYAGEISKQQTVVDELTESVAKAQKQTELFERGGLRGTGLNERAAIQEQLIRDTELLAAAQSDLTRLETERYEVSIIGSPAYIKQLREEAEQNKKNFNDKLNTQQVYQDQVEALQARAMQEGLRLAGVQTTDELDQLEYKQAQELSRIETQYSDKLKAEDAYQQLITNVQDRHLQERINKQREIDNEIAESAQEAFEKSVQAYTDIENQFVSNQQAILGQVSQLLSNFSDESALAAGAVAGIQVYAALSENALNLQRELSGINAAVYADPTIPTVAAKGAAAAALTAKATALSNVRAGLIVANNIAGQFHSGMENVPDTGSYLLSAGERVVQPPQNAQLKDFLNDYESGKGQPTQYTINMPLNMGKALIDDQEFSNKLIQMRNVVTAAVRKVERERPNSKRR
ncbi:hypothetical protein VIBRN418_01628 [Vibrio sp. N418]|uniref:phage tail length tape measure family protein n=1 Tax=Vibrio sp. (strain N418) TaxID=701176 RepID=UPI00021C076A|nr:phage tail length tape measure family protein [Vibrio sp. N418]EGU31482.1 hypothetical protein VIBRN418_01628 [Vibrio sp. N418]